MTSTIDTLKAEKKAVIIHVLKREIESSKKTLVEFGKKLKEDPFWAFRWGQEAFLASARIQVFSRIVDIFANPDSKQNIVGMQDYLQSELINNAKYPSFSTSKMQNLGQEYYNQAQAEALEFISYQKLDIA
jgi:uncharacterized protein (DUF2164 family)